MSYTILVADDDIDILDAVGIVLEDEGYTVITTSKGDEVLEFVEPLPDLYLLDIWMSGQDGKEICQRLKTNQHTRLIPVILFSANKDTAQIAAEAGADDYLKKPFDIDELLEKVKLYLS